VFLLPTVRYRQVVIRSVEGQLEGIQKSRLVHRLAYNVRDGALELDLPSPLVCSRCLGICRSARVARIPGDRDVSARGAKSAWLDRRSVSRRR
jgi:hypothetical protein